MKLRLIVSAVSLAAVVAAAAAQAAPATHQVSSVAYLGTPTLVPGAQATLVRNDNGVSMTLHTTGLPAGDAVTVWWVIFNQPQYCTHGMFGLRCGLGDLLIFGGDPRVESSVMYAAGHVIGGNGAGDYGAYLREGELTRDTLFGAGIVDSRTADVHLVVHDHGPAQPGIVDDEIHSFGVCNPTCTDIQAAAFEAGR
jgi:hypothetical protein